MCLTLSTAGYAEFQLDTQACMQFTYMYTGMHAAYIHECSALSFPACMHRSCGSFDPGLACVCVCASQANVLNNFPNDDAAANVCRLLLAITMFFTYPMEFFVARHALVSCYWEGASHASLCLQWPLLPC